MARLLVEIDEGLKRELKIRLLREGKTLKTWLTESAAAYVGAAPRRESVRAVGRESAHSAQAEPASKPAKRFDDYLD